MLKFVKLQANDNNKIEEMSQMATEIVREHYDPIIGKEQNDHMLKLFQSNEAIREQLLSGYQYYFVLKEEEKVGFVAFYPRDNVMYLSKFYLYKTKRGNGYARQMMNFVKEESKKQGLFAIELNVNKNNPAVAVYKHLGLVIARTEKNDIGNGFFMDDYVCRLEITD